MKKNSLFVAIVIVAAFVAAVLIYMFIFGSAAHFADAGREHPKDVMGIIYTGGVIVPLLFMLTIMVLTFIIERFFSLAKAKGTGDINKFLSSVEARLDEGNVDAAIDLCAKQRGTIANIIRAGLESFKKVRNENRMAAEVKLAEVKRTIEEATSIETPLLERNLIGLSTIASISTMVGLLGTVVGMIKAFRALGEQGAASATQLSIGISEALVNTAFGIVGAIIAIIFYNFFTTKVDSFIYTIDEAALNLIEQLETRFLTAKASA
ncbi:MAG TPA: MotA/TolQ/ExbB proton channel family protein [Candidatus Kapabacteria bacterium]|jgi:biopolymer transport protein ExbB